MKRITIFTTCFLAIMLSALLLAGSTAMGSTRMRAGSPPKNLRVTGVTDWTVNLRWDAPRGQQPTSYVVQCNTGQTVTVPGSQTSMTFSGGFNYLRTYTFRAYAVTNGNWSNASNQVTATLLNDTTPPTQPVVSAIGSGPTHVNLSWQCFDASPNLRFDVYVNDQLWYGQVAGTSKIVVPLQPNTSYSFKVRARDSGGNWSPMSAPFVAATPPADPNDIKPPSAPVIWGGVVDGQNEAIFNWADSIDNVTPSDFIRYELYVNGVFDGVTMGLYANQFFSYLTMGVINTIEIFAFDEAGNRSAASTMIIDLRPPSSEAVAHSAFAFP